MHRIIEATFYCSFQPQVCCGSKIGGTFPDNSKLFLLDGMLTYRVHFALVEVHVSTGGPAPRLYLAWRIRF